jgi:hypothetical protein
VMLDRLSIAGGLSGRQWSGIGGCLSYPAVTREAVKWIHLWLGPLVASNLCSTGGPF